MASDFYGLVFLDAKLNVLVQTQILFAGSNPNTISSTLNGSRAPSQLISGTTLGAPVELFTFPGGEYYEMEATLKVDSSNGQINFRVNGVNVLNYTTINTQGTAGSLIAYAGFWTANFYENGFEDLYGMDNTGTGIDVGFSTNYTDPYGLRIAPLLLTGDKSVEWSPSSGTLNADCINSVTFQGDNSYVESNTANAQDIYNVDTIAIYARVIGLGVDYVARATDAGWCIMAAGVQSSGTIFAGDYSTLTANYEHISNIYTTDPATNNPWQMSKFNSGQVDLVLNKIAPG